MRKIVSFYTLILENLPPGKARILYQMCAASEANPIKVNIPATIQDGNRGIVKESGDNLVKMRQENPTKIHTQGNRSAVQIKKTLSEIVVIFHPFSVVWYRKASELGCKANFKEEETMRPILDRLTNSTTNSKFKEAEDIPLRFQQSAPTSKQSGQKLRRNLADFFATKTKTGTDDPISNPRNFPISDVTGSRGLVSQEKKTVSDYSATQNASRTKQPYIPISVVTGSRDITTISPQLRAFLLKGSPSATTAMPEEYADLANVLEKAGDGIDFDTWGDMTAKQQLATAQKAGLSLEDQRVLLNTRPHYVETIAKVQDIFANRYELGITLADARRAAKELFDIANERNEAITKTGKYENDVVFAPRALRWLDEEENRILINLTKNASETDSDTSYNGGNPDLAARAARRATYADIDDVAATKQIEALIVKNVEDAKKVAFSSGANKFISEPTLFLSFYQEIKKDAPMDYKNPVIWSKVLPGLPYPEEDQIYNVFGIDISSSDLGNLNYALVGKALGIPESLLLQQAGAASLRDHENRDFIGSQRESMEKKDQAYGDQKDDQEMIANGFRIFDLLD